ncbi:NAD-dependent epimerase/dehydratase family protein [Roseibium aggregatum]|uniref:NAD-dependent epimerase/dehydratase family protein n=1 Tax=Roseibium aggregatum TaxID=187304 RepID=A0A939EG84_9HYPH|nr:NAD(P)-dependent oxidoreductase [Roseibium aggregatum]MBN9672662.1 NAD-dependent epimerase/dehydratase family protein [Roseibium aggregatum]
MKATVLGSSGFIGRAVTRHLRTSGYEVATPGRQDLATLSGNLGHVFYCIGLTGNFRKMPLATVDAHAGLLAKLLETAVFDSFLYFSSTRIYAQATGVGETGEDAFLKVRPSADTTYDLSKMLGEALCLALPSPTARVARLSNVYGPGQSQNTFLGSLLTDIASQRRAEIQEAASSSKDYISVDDVAVLSERIAREGRSRIYNLASGRPTSHDEIAGVLSNEGFSCAFAPGGVRRAFPEIDISRIRSEFGFSPRNLLEDLPSLLHAARKNSSQSGAEHG